MNNIHVFAFACSLCILLADLPAKEIIRYTGGSLQNQVGNKYHLQNLGAKITADGFVLSDDKKGFRILNSEDLNFNQTASLCMTIRLNTISTDTKRQTDNAYTDMFFSKKGQLFFGRNGNRLYANFNNGKKWYAYLLSDREHPLFEGNEHFIVLTVSSRNVPSSAEVWTDVKIYLDGREVLSRRIQGNIPNASHAPVDIGWAYFGASWNTNGRISFISIYDHVLSEEEIHDLTLKQKGVVPAFTVREKLSEEALQILQHAQKVYSKREVRKQAYASALSNLAHRHPSYSGWRDGISELNRMKHAESVLKTKSMSLIQLSDERSCLTLVSDAEKKIAGIISWYDLKNKREMLRYDNPFYAVKQGKKMISGSDPKISGMLIKRPDKDGNFILKYAYDGWKIKMFARFWKDRLQFSLEFKSEKPVSEITCPLLELQPLLNDDFLLTPQMGGVANHKPRNRNITYSARYPAGIASMQMGAYYDKNGGLYFATEDPTAYPKDLRFQANEREIRVAYQWKFPNVREFRLPGMIALELTGGSWYDAGLIYRRFLKQTPWWVQDLPRKDTPAWFRENGLVFSSRTESVDELKKMRRYMEEPYCLSWYEWHGAHDCDFPHFQSSPEVYLKNEALRKAGIRTVVYTNARIFEYKDVRCEDRDFSRIGKPLALRNAKGEMLEESYKRPFAVMCPAAQGWSDIIREFCIRLAAQNFDGIYLDQIGASRPLPCYAKNHNHLPGDMNHWYLQGYAKILTRIRNELKQRYPDVVLTTEDNAEPYAKLLDGMLPWRWIYDEQVPLYTLCYSGRVQFTGLPYGNGDNVSKYAKAAFQWMNGQWIGWFYPGYLFRDTEYALYVKQLVYARRALLDFFNCGMLERPVKFTKAPSERKILWFKKLGTQYVTTPDVLSACWKNQNERVFLFANHTEKKQNIEFELPESKAKRIICFSSRTPEQTFAFRKHIPLELGPHDITVILLSEQTSGTADKIRKYFRKMISFKKMELK